MQGRPTLLPRATAVRQSKRELRGRRCCSDLTCRNAAPEVATALSDLSPLLISPASAGRNNTREDVDGPPGVASSRRSAAVDAALGYFGTHSWHRLGDGD